MSVFPLLHVQNHSEPSQVRPHLTPYNRVKETHSPALHCCVITALGSILLVPLGLYREPSPPGVLITAFSQPSHRSNGERLSSCDLPPSIVSSLCLDTQTGASRGPFATDLARWKRHANGEWAGGCINTGYATKGMMMERCAERCSEQRGREQGQPLRVNNR